MIQLIGPALAGARLIGGAANVGRYAAGTGATLASLLTGSALNSGRRQNINERPVVNPQFLRPDYSGAGERARRFQEYKTGRDIPGANTDYSDRLAGSGYSSAPAAERAYQATKSSVAQQAAQNPEFQRYEAARKGAKTQEEMDAARDIGMQIWQEKYGGTKMGQQGGAVGSTNPLMARTFGYQTGGAPDQQMGTPTMGPSPLIPQVDQSLNPASPTYLGGEGPPLMNFADDKLTPEMIEAYQKQLLSQAASRK